MTLPDAFIKQARDVFDSEYRRQTPARGPIMEEDHHEANRAAIEAVVAVVRADQTRRIVEWAMNIAAAMYRTRNTGPGERWESVANAIEREFGTQPEERAA